MRVLLHIACFSTILAIHAQKPHFTPVESLEGVSVTQMEQDQQGLLHLLAKGSHMTYDGMDIQVFHDADSLSFNYMTQLESATLLGTAQGALYRKSPVGPYMRLASFSSGIELIAPLSPDSILIILQNGETQLYRPSTAAYSLLELPTDIGMSNDILVSDETLYFATDRGLWSCNPRLEEWQNYAELKNKIVTDLSSAGDKNLLIALYDGEIASLDIQNAEVEFVLSGLEPVQQIVHCPDRLLIYHGDRLMIHHLDTAVMSDRSYDMEWPNIQCMYVDDEWNLWIGSSTGVSKAPLHFGHWLSEPDSEVRALGYADGDIYYGTDRGVFRSGSEGEELIMESNVSCMDIDQGIKAVGTFNDGLFIAMGSSGFQQVQGLVESTVLAVEILSDARILVSTLGGTQYVHWKNGSFEAVEQLHDLDTYYILTIHEAHGGNIFLGTDRKGLILLKEGKAIHSNEVEGDVLGTVHGIAGDGEARILLTTADHGVVSYVDHELSKVPSPHEQWSEYTSIVQVNEEEFLLIGSEEVAVYRSYDNELMAFDEEIGIGGAKAFNNNYVKIGERILFEQSGNLYLYYARSQTARSASKTMLLSAEADLRPIDAKNAHLKEDENSVQFKFNGLLYRNPEKLYFQYRLDGFDSDWRVTQDRVVTYPNLDPGSYEFVLRSGHDRANFNGEEVRFPFQIQRYFYNTFWFRSLMLLLFLGFIIWAWRRRVKSQFLNQRLELLQSQSRLMGLKAQLNPHFLFNSFNTIIGLTEEDPARSVEFTELLTDFYRMVIEVTEEETIPIEKEMDLVRCYIQLLQIRFDGALDIQFQGEFTDFDIPPMTLQLLIENAVKHNRAEKAEPLHIEIHREADLLSVKNDKRPKATSPHSLGVGLNNLRSRYELLFKKEIVIKEDSTHFEVMLPIADS
ncbi:MAG: histidine kinase [Flavobacteriales bacterium]|nr:histidine kinase [Flavobacteriales bacterium]